MFEQWILNVRFFIFLFKKSEQIEFCFLKNKKPVKGHLFKKYIQAFSGEAAPQNDGKKPAFAGLLNFTDIKFIE